MRLNINVNINNRDVRISVASGIVLIIFFKALKWSGNAKLILKCLYRRGHKYLMPKGCVIIRSCIFSQKNNHQNVNHFQIIGKIRSII